MRYAIFAAATAAGLAVSSASATVIEGTLFRQDDATALSGNNPSDTHRLSTALMGPFNDAQSASANTPPLTANAHASQNSDIENAFYTAIMHGDASASGDGSGQASSATQNTSFPTRFSVAFTVDAASTSAIFMGTATILRSAPVVGQAGVSGSSLVQVLLLDLTHSANTVTIAQISTSSSNLSQTLNFNVPVTLVPGDSYTFQCNIQVSATASFANGAASASGDLNITGMIPAPASAALLGMGGLVGLRRRR